MTGIFHIPSRLSTFSLESKFSISGVVFPSSCSENPSTTPALCRKFLHFTASVGRPFPASRAATLDAANQMSSLALLSAPSSRLRSKRAEMCCAAAGSRWLPSFQPTAGTLGCPYDYGVIAGQLAAWVGPVQQRKADAMSTSSNELRDSGDRYRQLFQQLVDELQLVDGRIRFGFHEGSVTRLRLCATGPWCARGAATGCSLPAAGRSASTPSPTVFGPEYVAEFRAAVGRFGVCLPGCTRAAWGG